MYLTPREIVSELDKHIVGQGEAKKAVAVALRNRWRRQQLDEDLKREVVPKNILMIGPTGVGKTEIARRLARLAGAPFLKVEATKFTEVGYVGRDVEQIIRDLLDNAIHMVRENRRKDVEQKARQAAIDKVVQALVGEQASADTIQKFRLMVEQGLLNEREVDIEVSETPGNPFPTFDVPGMPGAQMGMINLGDMLGKAMGGGRKKTKKMPVADALKILEEEITDDMLDSDSITLEAINLVQDHGIVFLDEIDKICARSEFRGGDVSREGVQRDLLPLIEGTTVSTRHGTVKTDHILFIASGAFHLAKPSDLLPELQGRLPIRVQLQPLTREDFKRILTEPQACLLKQYAAMMQTEGVGLHFEESAVDALAEITFGLNNTVENIGARRLHTVMEKLLEEVSFNSDTMNGQQVTVDKAFVDNQLSKLQQDQDLGKFIL